MNGRLLRRLARLVSTMVGLTSLAFCASAQRNAFANLAPTPTQPVDLSVDSSLETDLPVIPAMDDEALPDAPVPNVDTPQQPDQQTSPGFPPVSPTPRRLPPSPAEHPSIPSLPAPCQTGVSTSAPENISCAKKVDYFQRFTNSGIHPMTPRQKGMLALRSTIDPYNFATIALVSAVSVASDPQSAYGPGFPGFGRNFGVAYCETAVGAFFGTFLVPTIFHQDPHYHRLPNASYPRRTLHAITQVVWAQNDYGVGIPNYSTFIATAIGDGLGNLYVPGRDTGFNATAARYATAIATDPIDNFINEFLPDVARRINVQIVLIHQVVNHVAKEQ
jgi:hypothetical protein